MISQHNSPQESKTFIGSSLEAYDEDALSSVSFKVLSFSADLFAESGIQIVEGQLISFNANLFRLASH